MRQCKIFIIYRVIQFLISAIYYAAKVVHFPNIEFVPFDLEYKSIKLALIKYNLEFFV